MKIFKKITKKSHFFENFQKKKKKKKKLEIHYIYALYGYITRVDTCTNYYGYLCHKMRYNYYYFFEQFYSKSNFLLKTKN